MHIFIVFKKSIDIFVNSNFKILIKKYPHLITSEMEDTNPHYHAIIYTKSITVAALRNQINRLEPGRKNKLQMKEVRDLPKSIIYILKELNVISNTLLTPDDLESYRQKTIAINVDRVSKMTPRQELIHNYTPMNVIVLPEIEIEYTVKYHISEYVTTNYPTTNPFSKKHQQEVAWAIWHRYYLPYVIKNNYLF